MSKSYLQLREVYHHSALSGQGMKHARPGGGGVAETPSPATPMSRLFPECLIHEGTIHKCLVHSRMSRSFHDAFRNEAVNRGESRPRREKLGRRRKQTKERESKNACRCDRLRTFTSGMEGNCWCLWEAWRYKSERRKGETKEGPHSSAVLVPGLHGAARVKRAAPASYLLRVL